MHPSRTTVPAPYYHLYVISDNLKARYWTWVQEMNGARERTGGPGSWTVPPPWKLYFNPWSQSVLSAPNAAIKDHCTNFILSPVWHRCMWQLDNWSVDKNRCYSLRRGNCIAAVDCWRLDCISNMWYIFCQNKLKLIESVMAEKGDFCKDSKWFELFLY